MSKFFRKLWGILLLLSVAWIGYGFIASSTSAVEVGQTATSDAELLGVGIGASLGLSLFLCTGLPVFFISGFFYWRNTSKLEELAKDRRHAEQLQALQNMKDQ